MDENHDVTSGGALDADERALAVHEAGHAAVARALGADVVFVEIDVGTGNGASCSRTCADDIKTLAVLAAGHKAENAFAAKDVTASKVLSAHAVRSAHDLRRMEELLSRLPEVERGEALAEGFTLADETLKSNADVVHRIADALFARRWSRSDGKVRIEGDELVALLAGAGPA